MSKSASEQSQYISSMCFAERRHLAT